MKVVTIAKLRPALLLSAVLVIGAGAGYAQNYSGTWHIVSKIGPALCVGENDRNDSDPVVILNSYGADAPHTQWVLELQSDGSYIITNVKTQKVIDVPYANKDNSVPLIQYSRHGGANQRWRVQTDRDGYVSFVSVESEKFIEIPNGVRVDNTQVIQYTYNNGDDQKFKLEPVGAAVCPTCGVSNAQSDAKEAGVSSKRARRIDVSSSFSYYFSTDGGRSFDSIAPATFRAARMSNLSLSMGLNVYKGVGAYIDFGIKDKAAKKAINWASRIGSKYFDMQIEYDFIGGEVSYWEDANIGVNKDTPPDLTADYDQTWITVALMYPFPIKDFCGLLGLFYNHATVPGLIWVNKESEDEGSRFAFLDKSCPVTVYGIRMYWDNVGLKRVPDNLRDGWTVKLPWRFVVDYGLGFADPDKDVVALATEKGGRFSDYSFMDWYLKGRLALNCEFFNKFTENQTVYFGLGVEFHGLGYLRMPENESHLKVFDNWSTISVSGWGLIGRVGYAW